LNSLIQPRHYMLPKTVNKLGTKGQSTLEYLMIWTVVVGAILSAAGLYLRPTIEGAVEMSSTKITTEVAELLYGLGD